MPDAPLSPQTRAWLRAVAMRERDRASGLMLVDARDVIALLDALDAAEARAAVESMSRRDRRLMAADPLTPLESGRVEALADRCEREARDGE